jgi:hypothetical protein
MAKQPFPWNQVERIEELIEHIRFTQQEVQEIKEELARRKRLNTITLVFSTVLVAMFIAIGIILVGVS